MDFANFVGRKVLVKTWDGLQVEGILLGIERSHHGPVGNVVLKTENGYAIVRGDLWSIVALEKGFATNEVGAQKSPLFSASRLNLGRRSHDDSAP